MNLQYIIIHPLVHQQQLVKCQSGWSVFSYVRKCLTGFITCLLLSTINQDEHFYLALTVAILYTCEKHRKRCWGGFT